MDRKDIYEAAPAVFAYLAQQIKPHLEPTPRELEFYLDPANLKNTPEQLLAKSHEAINGFERALLESYWNVDKDFLLIEASTAEKVAAEAKIAELQKEVDLALKEERKDDAVSIGTDLEKAKKALALALNAINNWTAKLASDQDTMTQQQAYLTVIRARVSAGAKDMLAVRFASTDEIRAASAA